MLLGDSAAGVFDFDHGVVPWLHGLEALESLGEQALADSNEDLATVVHRIRRVDDQIRDRTQQVFAGDVHGEWLLGADKPHGDAG